MSETPKTPWWAQAMLGVACAHAGAGTIMAYRSEVQIAAVSKKVDSLEVKMDVQAAKAAEDLKAASKDAKEDLEKLRKELLSRSKEVETRDRERVKMVQDLLEQRIQHVEEQLNRLQGKN